MIASNYEGGGNIQVNVRAVAFRLRKNDVSSICPFLVCLVVRLQGSAMLRNYLLNGSIQLNLRKKCVLIHFKYCISQVSHMAKKPFGGYTISFKGRKETVEDVFGSKPIPPSEMTKKLWAFVKRKKLSSK